MLFWSHWPTLGTHLSQSIPGEMAGLIRIAAEKSPGNKATPGSPRASMVIPYLLLSVLCSSFSLLASAFIRHIAQPDWHSITTLNTLLISVQLPTLLVSQSLNSKFPSNKRYLFVQLDFISQSPKSFILKRHNYWFQSNRQGHREATNRVGVIDVSKSLAYLLDNLP